MKLQKASQRAVAAIFMMLILFLPSVGEASAEQGEKHLIPGGRAESGRVESRASECFTYGRFGEMNIYFPKGEPADLVLFVSGGAGWNENVSDMARALTEKGALVAGIDINHLYRTLELNKEKCTYPAADFEGLAHALEEHYRFSDYRYPYLIGYGSGAALVYAMLAQAPEGTFAGGMSLGLCPRIQLGVPLCESSLLKWTQRNASPKGYDLSPATALSVPWIVLQGVADPVCSPEETAVFVKKVEQAEWVTLPKTGAGDAAQAGWMPQFLAAYERLHTSRSVAAKVTAPQPDAPSDLPLTEVSATAPVKPDQPWSGALAVILTGDGGWAGLDREVAAALTAQGIPVVGFSTLQYFWSVKTPEQTAKDVERVMRYYLHHWQKQSVILIGYSMGAEVLPFVVNRLPVEMQNRVATVASIAPGRTAEFEFHFSNWVPAPAGSRTRDLPIAPEVEKLSRPFTCIYPKEEDDSLCLVLDAKRYTVEGLPGGHHFNGDYARLVQIILNGMHASK